MPETDPEYASNNKFQNYWGYEIDMMNTAAKHFNFTYTLNNPVTGVWATPVLTLSVPWNILMATRLPDKNCTFFEKKF